MLKQLRALIIDDEPLAHQVILHHLAEHSDITVAGSCYSAKDGIDWLANNNVDLLFLDIAMPNLNGIELLKALPDKPQVIIVSAYQEYAIQGFELEVTDYLLKPVSAERLSQALVKVRRGIIYDEKVKISTQKKDELLSSITYLMLKVDREKRRFNLAEITFLEAYGNYVKVWQGLKVTLVLSTLKDLLNALPSSDFMQVHKSFVINKHSVIAYGPQKVRMNNGEWIKVGKSFKQAIPTLGNS